MKFPHKRLRFCNNSNVDIKNEIRDDFLSVILLHCSNCKVDYPVCSEDPDMDLMNVNLAFVAGIVSLGLSLHQLNDLCSSLQIPRISFKNYSEYLDKIYDIYNESVGEKSKDSSKASTTTATGEADHFDGQTVETLSTPNLDFQKYFLRSSTPNLKIDRDDFESRKEKFLESLELTVEEIEIMSALTVNQSDDPLWHQERKKRLTASNFGRICKLLDSTDKSKVARDLLSSNFTGNIYTKYGKDNELNALKEFMKIMGITVKSCGLFVDRNYPFLAASPDGLIDDDGMVEIKCPYKARNLLPEDAIEQKMIQFATFEDGKFRLKRTDKYYYQVQGQLFVTGRKFCYFIVWTPHGLLYEKIERDEECWSKMLPKLEKFYFEYLLPVILE